MSRISDKMEKIEKGEKGRYKWNRAGGDGPVG